MDPTREPAAELQFDTVTPATSEAGVPPVPTGVSCAACARPLDTEYFDVNGKPVCDSCRAAVERHTETPGGLGVFARAILFGVGAAIAGAVLYYAVIAITEFEIGLVAIAIGYMVGYAVRAAAGGRGGRRFQVLAIVLTYWAVGLAYTPIVLMAGAEAQTKQRQEPVGVPEASLTTTVNASASEGPGFSLIAVTLLVVSFALPVMMVVASLPGGLISAAIIAFGMLQAWRMTASPQLQISGPYRIGSAPSSTA
jgi:hypothetical protein